MKQETVTTILLADDEKEIRDALEEILGREGYHVVTAGNGEEAYDMYKIISPDIVLTDIVMPVMDGFELLRKIKAENQEDIVIMFSSFDKPIESLRLRADDYIAKPVKKHELLHRIRENLEHKTVRLQLEKYERLQYMMEFLEAEWRSFGSHEYGNRLNAISNMVLLAKEEVEDLLHFQRKACAVGPEEGPKQGEETFIQHFGCIDIDEIVNFLEIAGTEINRSIDEGEMLKKYYTLSPDKLFKQHFYISDVLETFCGKSRDFLLGYGRRDLNLLSETSSGIKDNEVVFADKALILNDVLGELFKNACRHTREGNIIVRPEKENGNIRITVSDTGDGIEEKYRDKVFFPRTFAHSYLNHSSVGINPIEYGKSGFGMGLSFAKRVVELHGGEIGFESVSGEGSSFHFTLPLHEETALLGESSWEI